MCVSHEYSRVKFGTRSIFIFLPHSNMHGAYSIFLNIIEYGCNISDFETKIAFSLSAFPSREESNFVNTLIFVPFLHKSPQFCEEIRIGEPHFFHTKFTITSGKLKFLSFL